MTRFVAMLVVLVACSSESEEGTATSTGTGGSGGGQPVERVIVFDASGEVRSLDFDLAIAADASLGTPVANVRYAAGTLYVVHPDRIALFDPASLEARGAIELPDANARDIVVMDESTAYVTQFDDTAIARIDLASRTISAEIELGSFADGNGLPDMNTMARCGSQLFVQLQRRERQASEQPVIAIVDTNTSEVQSIALEGPTPDYDMHPDCEAGRLFVVEPVPVMIGGGGIEELDIAALQSLGFFLSDADAGGETGGFLFTAPGEGWLIIHTEFGSGPSSHLGRFPGTPAALWDTFQRVDRIAFDALSGELFFPDPCTDCVHPAGLVAFDAMSGELLTETPVDVGFPPTGVVVAR